MWTIKYCGAWNYKPQAERLSAAINNTLPDTCEIEEGETGQYELFFNGESFLRPSNGKFFGIEDVKKKMLESGRKLFTD